MAQGYRSFRGLARAEVTIHHHPKDGPYRHSRHQDKAVARAHYSLARPSTRHGAGGL